MCNVESSRSHGVFCVRVISAEPTPWGGEITRDGRLNLVDLSGSENIKRSGAVGARAKEAAAIGQVRPIGYVAPSTRKYHLNLLLFAGRRGTSPIISI